METLLIIMAQMVIQGIPKHTEIILIIMIIGAIIALHHDTETKSTQTVIDQIKTCKMEINTFSGIIMTKCS